MGWAVWHWQELKLLSGLVLLDFDLSTQLGMTLCGIVLGECRCQVCLKAL